MKSPQVYIELTAKQVRAIERFALSLSDEERIGLRIKDGVVEIRAGSYAPGPWYDLRYQYGRF